MFSLHQGDVLYCDFGEPRGSLPAKRRPVLVIQNNDLNQSELKTTIVVPLSSNLALANFSNNVFLSRSLTKLPKDSVTVAHLPTVVNKEDLEYPVALLSGDALAQVLAGVHAVTVSPPAAW